MKSTVSLIGALVSSAAVVIVGLLVAFGVPLTVEQVAAITSAAAFAGTVLTVILFLLTLPREKVLEYLVGADKVVAGAANEVVGEGEEIRHLGDMPRRAAVE